MFTKLSDIWSVGVALSRSQRAPVVEELYSNEGKVLGDYVPHIGRIELGNTALDKEQANNLDLTVNFATEKLSGYLTTFYNDFTDFIYLQNTDQEQDKTMIFSYQQQDAEFYGAEFEMEFAIGRALGGDFSIEFYGDWIRGELDSGKDIPRLVPHRLGSRVNYQRDGLTFYLGVLDADDQKRTGEYEEPSEGYSRWNAGVDYRFNLSSAAEMLVFLKLKNLTDEEIRHSTSFLREVAPESGRSIESGIRLTF